MSTSSFTRMKSGGGKCCGGSLAMTSATPASGHHHHGSRSFVLLFPLFLSLCVFPTFVMASRGDRDYTFHNCLVKCKQNSCVGNGMHECIFTIELNAFSFFGVLNQFCFQIVDYIGQANYLKYLSWDCDSECKYHCMWQTVSTFQQHNIPVPQFFGKV